MRITGLSRGSFLFFAISISPNQATAAANILHFNGELETLASSMRKDANWPALALFYASPRQSSLATSGDSVNSESIFGIGSCTKSMTATLLAKHIEQGTFTWEMPLKKVFEILSQNAQVRINLSPALEEVTLESLLTHTGNMPDDYVIFDADFEKSVEDFLQKGSGENSEDFHYSTVAYSVLGYITAKLEGLRWDSMLKKNLFDPLEMKSCLVQPAAFEPQPQFFLELEKFIPLSFFDGKIERIRELNNFEKPNITPGAGVFCSLKDWDKYLQFLIRGYHGEVKGMESLPSQKETFAKLFQQKAPHNYSYGAWQLKENNFHYHNGSNGAFISVGSLNLQNREVMLAVTNTNAAGDFNQLHWMADQSVAFLRMLEAK